MSKSKLALRAIGIIVVTACGYAGGVLSTRHPVEEAKVRAANSRPGVWSRLPRVYGRIVACLPSPDFSRIAVAYTRQTPLCPIQTIAIFDLKQKKLRGDIRPAVGAPSAPWTWSPDSKWLTIPEEERETRMISRDGRVKVVPTNRVATDIVWRQDEPRKFLYTCCDPYVYEYDLSTHRERPIKTEFTYAEWLCTVNGKPCVMGVPNDSSRKSIKACLVDTGRAVLSVTAPSNGKHSSIYSIEMSPDGRFVALVSEDHTGVIGIIARVTDLGSVLSDRSRALYVEERSHPFFRVAWPTYSGNSVCIVSGRAVDLSDGCIKYVYEGVTRLAHWTPITRNSKQIPRWLEVGYYGLYICGDDHSLERIPILGHRAMDGRN